jgi:hypothetical protein
VMLEQGKVTPEQASVALATPLDSKLVGQRLDLLAPHFSIAARRKLANTLFFSKVFHGNKLKINMPRGVRVKRL